MNVLLIYRHIRHFPECTHACVYECMCIFINVDYTSALVHSSDSCVNTHTHTVHEHTHKQTNTYERVHTRVHAYAYKSESCKKESTRDQLQLRNKRTTEI
jgi:hypothetical protein